jgi:hypothetical protein
MRGAYRVLASLLALEVIIQAAAVVYGVFGLANYVDGGHTITAQDFEENSDLSFSGLGGLILHGMNGMMIIPLIALLLLIVSFFAKVKGGIITAAVLVVLVALQIALGLIAHSVEQIGILHGINAFLILGGAIHAARAARKVEVVVVERPAEATPA